MHKAAIIIVLVILLVLILIAGVATYFFHYALDSDFSGGISFASPYDGDEGEAKKADYESFLSETSEDVYITSEDGLRLHGYLSASNVSHVYSILVHGYKSQGLDMVPYARHYYDEGYNYLVIDHRAHASSEGQYISMGYYEKYDLIRWIDYIISLDPEARIILHGVSMGAATVMMATGESLPSNVVAAVEDCGYTSVWDIFADQLKDLFHLPAFPLLDATSLETKLRLGFSFKEASTVEAVSRSVTPTLFIHGEEDDFVGYYMLSEVYNAAGCEKERLDVPGAGHAESLSTSPELYWGRVDSFIERYI